MEPDIGIIEKNKTFETSQRALYQDMVECFLIRKILTLNSSFVKICRKRRKGGKSSWILWNLKY